MCGHIMWYIKQGKKDTCRSILKQNTEPQNCVAASTISEGPAMSWWLIQGVPWPSPIDQLKKGDMSGNIPATLTEKVEEIGMERKGNIWLSM